MDNKINNIQPLIIIQARIGSSRLPGKVMREIDGVTLIEHLINRLRKSLFKIVVAIPDTEENNELEAHIKSLGISTFQGDELNVLKRFYDTALEYKTKDIIRITADNPLTDGIFIKDQIAQIQPKLRRYYLSEGGNKSLPLGTSFELFSFELLEEAYQNATSEEEKEHVTPYMNQNLPGNIELLEIVTDLHARDLRLTVDTNQDFELMKILIERYNANHLSVSEIIKLLRKNNDLIEINKNIKQVRVKYLGDE
jgi:spore coat polysaccharide biosynthesis protein SpsF (cytidylyltransferase family)